MKRVSNYLKMRVLGALEHAPGNSNHARYKAVSAMTFTDEDGAHVRFTWRTIQTWWYYYRRYDLLKPASDSTPKVRLAFAKAHANDLWQGDTLHGPYLELGIRQSALKTFLICFIDDASRVIPHGAFYAADDTANLIDCFQNALNTTLQLRHHLDIKSRVTYSARLDLLAPATIESYLHNQLDEAGLPHSTFSDEAIALIIRISEGILRTVRNLCIGALIEAVRDQTKTAGSKQINAVLMQPHWRQNSPDEPAQPLIQTNQKPRV